MYGLTLASIARLLRRLARDRRGAVAVFLAAAVTPIIAGIGLSVDGARGWLVKSRLSQALDAAALAGGRVIFSPTRDDDIRMFFNANFPAGFMEAAVTGPTISVDTASENITLSATATIPTTFMRVVGIGSITVRADTVVNRQSRGMELVLVMDNTGSMWTNDRIGKMKTAAADLVNILYGSQETLQNFWIGLVPYTALVNIGPGRAAWTNTPVWAPVSVSSLVRSTNSGTSSPQTSTVCVTTTTAHGLQDGAIVDISGANQAEYNGRFMIRTTDTSGCSPAATRFWYVISSTSPATPATGTIRAQRPAVDYSPGTWKGCVEARPAPYEEDQAEALPGALAWNRAFWPSTHGVRFYDSSKNLLKVSGGSPRPGDNQWGPAYSPPTNETSAARNDAYGPNLGCGPAVLPLQPSKAAALAAISDMAPWSRGGTMANLGLAWGWRMLSPGWRGMWGSPMPDNLPLDYNTPLMDKVVVLLTDGTNEWYDWNGSGGRAPGCAGFSSPCPVPTDADYTAYGRLSEGRLGTTSNGTATTVINSRMSQLCTAMKAKGIIIYTIVVEVPNTATNSLYQGCASKPEYYFPTPDANDLSAVFREIASQLSNLRLAR